jgi:hypothetical protein
VTLYSVAPATLFQVNVNVRGLGGKCCPLFGDIGSGVGKSVGAGLTVPPSPALSKPEISILFDGLLKLTTFQCTITLNLIAFYGFQGCSERRGWHWALTGFALDAYGAAEEDLQFIDNSMECLGSGVD